MVVTTLTRLKSSKCAGRINASADPLGCRMRTSGVGNTALSAASRSSRSRARKRWRRLISMSCAATCAASIMAPSAAAASARSTGSIRARSPAAILRCSRPPCGGNLLQHQQAELRHITWHVPGLGLVAG